MKIDAPFPNENLQIPMPAAMAIGMGIWFSEILSQLKKRPL
ncbi:MAG: hypothetical protein AAFQ63_19255 [Cyanobacteria bacterium J06621_11]